MTGDRGTVIPILPTSQRAGRPGGRRDGLDLDAPGTLGNVLQDMLLHSGLAIYVFEAQGGRFFINDPFREIYSHITFGLGRDDKGPLPVPGTIEPVIDEIRSTGRKLIRVERVELAACTKHFLAHHFPIYRGKEIVAVGGIYHDVTRQTVSLDQARESQTRLDDVIRSTSDWVWETDATGKITFVSDRITEILGRPPSTLVGRGLFDVGHFSTDDGKPATGPNFYELCQPFRNRPFEIRDRDGQTRRLHLSGVPVFERETGKLAGYRGTGTDITAQHAAEASAQTSRRDLESTLEELKNKNLQLEAALDRILTATKVKSEFLATMSHELRTPLNAIIGFAEVMLLNTFGDLPPKYESYVKEITDAGRHLLSKINDILDVANAENNELTVTARPTSLKEVIERALSQVALRAAEKRIDISRVRLAEDRTLQVDPERAEQIFANLLSNAIKFTTELGTVGVDMAPGAEGMLDITVWDTGIGIPADKQDAIFESFHQIHEGIFSRTQEGTGIGLTVARHMAVLLGGDIRLESTPGEGSRFTVSLPLATDGDGSQPASS